MSNDIKKTNKKENQHEQSEQSKDQHLVYQEALYSGPLPHPTFFKEYEQVLPGATDRILKMAERQSAHRQQVEKKLIDFAHKETTRGQYFGLCIGSLAIIAGAITAILGAEISGGFIGTAGVVGLVSVFVIGSRKKQQHTSEE